MRHGRRSDLALDGALLEVFRRADLFHFSGDADRFGTDPRLSHRKRLDELRR